FGVVCLSKLGQREVSEINLPNSGLVGSLPERIWPALASLHSLSLHSNQISGSLPAFGKLPSLRSVLLFSNKLSGALPASAFAEFINLQILDLHDNLLTGPVPPFDLIELKTLDIGHNLFSGPLPELKLWALERLILAHNPIAVSASWLQ